MKKIITLILIVNFGLSLSGQNLMENIDEGQHFFISYHKSKHMVWDVVNNQLTLNLRRGKKSEHFYFQKSTLENRYLIISVSTGLALFADLDASTGSPRQLCSFVPINWNDSENMKKISWYITGPTKMKFLPSERSKVLPPSPYGGARLTTVGSTFRLMFSNRHFTRPENVEVSDIMVRHKDMDQDNSARFYLHKIDGLRSTIQNVPPSTHSGRHTPPRRPAPRSSNQNTTPKPRPTPRPAPTTRPRTGSNSQAPVIRGSGNGTRQNPATNQKCPVPTGTQQFQGKNMSVAEIIAEGYSWNLTSCEWIKDCPPGSRGRRVAGKRWFQGSWKSEEQIVEMGYVWDQNQCKYIQIQVSTSSGQQTGSPPPPPPTNPGTSTGAVGSATWASIIDAIEINGGLQKTTSDFNYKSGGFVRGSLAPNANGIFQCELPDPKRTNAIVGFFNATTKGVSTTQYGFYCASGSLRTIVNGAIQSTVLPYQNGALKVQVNNGKVQFFINGKIVHSVNANHVVNLQAGVALRNRMAAVSKVMSDLQ